jgi:hypothetical protein
MPNGRQISGCPVTERDKCCRSAPSFAAESPAACILAGNGRGLHRKTVGRSSRSAGKDGGVARAHAPAQVLHFGAGSWTADAAVLFRVPTVTSATSITRSHRSSCPASGHRGCSPSMTATACWRCGPAIACSDADRRGCRWREPTITSHRAAAPRLPSVKASTLRSLMWLAVFQTNCRLICGNPRKAPPAPRCAGLFIWALTAFC